MIPPNIVFIIYIIYGADIVGTGKTLLARACAKNTDAIFLKLAGPQLVQMFIGDGTVPFCSVLFCLYMKATEHRNLLPRSRYLLSLFLSFIFLFLICYLLSAISSLLYLILYIFPLFIFTFRCLFSFRIRYLPCLGAKLVRDAFDLAKEKITKEGLMMSACPSAAK